MYVGGCIGSGSMMVSWVHIEDVYGMILMALDGRAGWTDERDGAESLSVIMERLAEGTASSCTAARTFGAGRGHQSALR